MQGTGELLYNKVPGTVEDLNLINLYISIMTVLGVTNNILCLTSGKRDEKNLMQ